MGQYFTNDPNLQHSLHTIETYFRGQKYTFKSDSGVFSKNAVDFGTKTLLEASLNDAIFGYGLDLGCGLGIVGIITSLLEPKITCFDFVDINERCIELTKENLEKYHVSYGFVRASNCFDQVDKYDYDFILTNPPIRAGKKIVYAFYEGALTHLKENGSLYVVIQKKQGAESSISKLKEIFGNCCTIAKEKGYFILKSTKK